MKKILLVCAFLAVAFSSEGQVRFGLKAGLNVSNIRAKGDDNKKSTDPKAGFHGGVVLDVPIAGNFYFNPQLLFSQKGGKEDEVFVSGFGDVDTKVTLNYLSVPFDFNYRLPVGQLSVDFLLGPYMAFAVSSKSKVHLGGETVTHGDGIFGEYGVYKRFDMGLRLGAGMHINEHASYALSYEIGMTNLLKKTIDDYSEKNGAFMVSFGWTF